MKCSVVIPTMWRSSKTYELIYSLNASDMVDEIIIIDNAPKSKVVLLPYPKVQYKPYSTNQFVNQSWNIGVKSAKNDLVVIANDDILFDVDDYLDTVLKHEHLLGCMGVDGDSINKTSLSTSIKQVDFTSEYIGRQSNGWGCLITLKKSNWQPIPPKIKIWFGDDWIAKTNKPCLKIKLKGGVETNMSETSKDISFRKTIMADLANWKKINR